MGGVQGESTAEIDAPLETVWSLVADVERAPEWQGGMTSVRALERDGAGRALVCEVVADGKVRALRSTVHFDYDGAPHRLAWHAEGGDIKSLVGSWDLDDLDEDRTRARYAIDVDLGRALGLVIRGPVLAVLRDQLAGARAAELKAAVERE